MGKEMYLNMLVPIIIAFTVIVILIRPNAPPSNIGSMANLVAGPENRTGGYASLADACAQSMGRIASAVSIALPNASSGGWRVQRHMWHTEPQQNKDSAQALERKLAKGDDEDVPTMANAFGGGAPPSALKSGLIAVVALISLAPLKLIL